jgi:hypothetical protein
LAPIPKLSKKKKQTNHKTAEIQFFCKICKLFSTQINFLWGNTRCISGCDVVVKEIRSGLHIFELLMKETVCMSEFERIKRKEETGYRNYCEKTGKRMMIEIRRTSQ